MGSRMSLACCRIGDPNRADIGWGLGGGIGFEWRLPSGRARRRCAQRSALDAPGVRTPAGRKAEKARRGGSVPPKRSRCVVNHSTWVTTPRHGRQTLLTKSPSRTARQSPAFKIRFPSSADVQQRQQEFVHPARSNADLCGHEAADAPRPRRQSPFRAIPPPRPDR